MRQEILTISTKKFIDSWKYIILLFLLITFHFVNNYIWISKDCGVSLGCDTIFHLIKRINFYNQLKVILNTKFSIASFFALFKADESCWPKFVYFLVSLVNLLFGNTDFVTRLSNMIYFVILIVSIYLIGKTCLDRKTGLLSAFIISFYPGLFGMSRKFTLDFPLTAMVCLAIYFLLRAGNFKNLKYSLIFGIVCGLGIITKSGFIVFIIGPLIFVLFSEFFRKSSGHKKPIQFFNLILFLSLTALISSIWWYGHLIRLLQTFWDLASALYGYFPGKIINPVITVEAKSSNWLLYYIKAAIENISPFFFIIFIISIFFFLRSKTIKNKILIFLWIFIPYIIFTFISIKYNRYYFPSFPAIALVSAVGILGIKSRLFKKGVLFTIVIVAVVQFFIRTYDINKYLKFLDKLISGQRYEWFNPPETNNYKKIVEEFIGTIEQFVPSGEPLRIGIVNLTDYLDDPFTEEIGDWTWRLVYFAKLKRWDISESFLHMHKLGFAIKTLNFLIFSNETGQELDVPNYKFLRQRFKKMLLVKKNALSFGIKELPKEKKKFIKDRIIFIEEIIEELNNFEILKKALIVPGRTYIFLLKRKKDEGSLIQINQNENIFFGRSFFGSYNIVVYGKPTLGAIVAQDNAPCFVEYRLNFLSSGQYELWAQFASAESRPMDIFLDDQIIIKKGFKEVTGNFSTDTLTWFKVGIFNVSQSGEHKLRLASNHHIPHIKKIMIKKIL